MTLLNHIVLASAIGIQLFVSMRNSTAEHPVRLTRALLNSMVATLLFLLLFWCGLGMGQLLRFDLPEVDRNIFLGLFLLVIIKILFGLKRAATPADVSQWKGLLLLSFALGINVLILGIGLGFILDTGASPWRWATPQMVVVPLMGFWGSMLGRQQVDVRPKRWQLLSLLMFLVVAIVAYFN